MVVAAVRDAVPLFSVPRAAALGGLSLRRFGDFRAGGHLGVKAPSGYSEIDGDLSLLARLSPADLVTVGIQNVHLSDVPRFDQIAERGYARYSFDPQVRRLASVRFEHFSSSSWAKSLSVSGSWHHSIEGRHRQRSGTTALVTEQDVVGVAGFTMDVKSEPRAGLTLVSGVDAYRDRVRSWRADIDTTTGRATPKRGLYPDGARASSARDGSRPARGSRPRYGWRPRSGDSRAETGMTTGFPLEERRGGRW